MNTLDEYMRDSRIEANEPNSIKRIHAIRLRNYDRTKDMTPSEYTAYVNNEAARVCKKYNITAPQVDLAGAGRVRPYEPAMVFPDIS